MPWSATASGSASAASRAGEALGQAQERRRPSRARSGRRRRRGRRSRPFPCGARTGRACPPGSGGSAPQRGRRTAHHRVADRPVTGTSAPTAATVPVNSWPATSPGFPPSLEHDVDVGAADAAVARPPPAPRRDPAAAPAVPRPPPRPAPGRRPPASPRAHRSCRHRARHGGHAPTSPIICATRARWWAPEPNIAAVAFTRFTYMCISCSHV